jgi:hypothetical protein
MLAQNKALQPIASLWLAPAELFVGLKTGKKENLRDE